MLLWILDLTGAIFSMFSSSRNMILILFCLNPYFLLVHFPSSNFPKVTAVTCRYDVVTNVLVCSRGGGGLLIERMELLAELWEENIRVSCSITAILPGCILIYEMSFEHSTG